MVSTYYFSSSGGYTESAKNVWGGDDAPYCAAVPDPYEDQDAITHFSETVTLDEGRFDEFYRQNVPVLDVRI